MSAPGGISAPAGSRAFRLVDCELEVLGQEQLDVRRHPLACSLTAHINVAVIGMSHEVVTALHSLHRPDQAIHQHPYG
jgi:hypothetical protein